MKKLETHKNSIFCDIVDKVIEYSNNKPLQERSKTRWSFSHYLKKIRNNAEEYIHNLLSEVN